MEKSLQSFLSLLLIPALAMCQSGLPTHMKVQVNCSNKKVRDSLVVHYIDNGAAKHFYNEPEWEIYCDSLIAICPNIAEVYRVKAIPYIKNGDYATAFALENKAVELDPKQWTAYRGFLKLIFTKDYEGAIIDFQKAQQLTPNGFEMDHTYFFYMGLCNLELGNYAQAEKDLKQDIFIQTQNDSSGSPHFNTLLYMGILYYEMGENALAKDYLSRCLAQYKQLPEASFYMSMIYKQEKGKESRWQYLATAKEMIKKRYGMNEDNMYYAYYPHQITLFEIEEEEKSLEQ
jgi:tetratricopeptide (TPR) repeat protein